jgi:hypothetical protein
MSSCKASSMNNAQGGGGIRKKNGHKDNCKCPICVNMKHAKGGAGYDVEQDDEESSSMQEGGKKSNGHKANCKCPICKNMKKNSAKNGAMKGGYSKNITLKGGKKSNGHKADCKCPICKNMKKRGGKGEGEESSSSDMSDSSSSSDMNDMNDISFVSDSSDQGPMIGGKKSNGHKANCMCPICKNMKKRGKKTQRKTKGGNKKSHRRH